MRIFKALAATVLITSAGATIAMAQPTSSSNSPGPASPPVGAASSAMSPSPALRAARRDVRKMCASDLAKACPDARPGKGGGMAQCMKQHYGEFSSSCQDALKSMREARQAAQ
jgi:hypothetical protein